MSQQDVKSVRNNIIGVISIVLVMVTVGSVVIKMVGLEFGGAASTESAPTAVAQVAKVYSQENLAAGKKVYEMACTACHTPGMAGAPKIGDSASWVGRIDKDEAILVSNVINGFNVMPPRGGRSELSDEEIEWAVRYMLDSVK